MKKLELITQVSIALMLEVQALDRSELETLIQELSLRYMYTRNTRELSAWLKKLQARNGANNGTAAFGTRPGGL